MERATPPDQASVGGPRDRCRRQLIQALAGAATRSGAELELGSVAVGAGASGVLLTEDGRRLRADLVVGADGVYSKVRDSLREGTAVPVNHASWIRSFPLLEDVIRRVGTDGRWDLFEFVDLHTWSAGRVAIVGDAANAMSPNTGQGAGTAGMNALSLAVHVSEAPTIEDGTPILRYGARSKWLMSHRQRAAHHIPTGAEAFAPRTTP